MDDQGIGVRLLQGTINFIPPLLPGSQSLIFDG